VQVRLLLRVFPSFFFKQTCVALGRSCEGTLAEKVPYPMGTIWSKIPYDRVARWNSYGIIRQGTIDYGTLDFYGTLTLHSRQAGSENRSRGGHFNSLREMRTDARKKLANTKADS